MILYLTDFQVLSQACQRFRPYLDTLRGGALLLAVSRPPGNNTNSPSSVQYSINKTLTPVSLFFSSIHSSTPTCYPFPTVHSAYLEHHTTTMTPDNIDNIDNTSLPHRPRRISPTNTDGSMSQSHQSPPSPRSPHSPSLSSLQAAATLNAGLRSSPPTTSPSGLPVKNTIERRRSSLLNNFALNDPTIPAPGEMQQSYTPRSGRRSSVVSPAVGGDLYHHHRQPSLGEMYQDMEIETEGRVNRLLYDGPSLSKVESVLIRNCFANSNFTCRHMIRLQQDQLAALQSQNNQSHDSSAIAPTPPMGTSRPSSAHPQDSQPQQPAASAASTSRSPSFSNPPAAQPGLPHGHGIFNRPHSLSRQSSARISNNASQTTSPALHPSSGLGPLTEDFLLGGGKRDDAAFYQAETHMLTRENQMLKFRIRELG